MDWPTKVRIIVEKTDAQSLGYVIEALYTQMARKNEADPYGSGELKSRINEILWQRTYVTKCLNFCYRDLCKDAGWVGASQAG